MTAIPATPFPLHKELRLAYLIHRFLQKKLSRAERTELDQWVGASDDNMLVFEALTDDFFQQALTLNPALIEAFGHYQRKRQQNPTS